MVNNNNDPDLDSLIGTIPPDEGDDSRSVYNDNNLPNGNDPGFGGNTSNMDVDKARRDMDMAKQEKDKADREVDNLDAASNNDVPKTNTVQEKTKEKTKNNSKKLRQPTFYESRKNMYDALQSQARQQNTLSRLRLRREREKKNELYEKSKKAFLDAVFKTKNKVKDMSKNAQNDYEKYHDKSFKDVFKQAGHDSVNDLKDVAHTLGAVFKYTGGFAISKAKDHFKQNREKYAQVAEKSSLDKDEKPSLFGKIKNMAHKTMDKIKQHFGRVKAVSNKAAQKARTAIKDPDAAYNKMLDKFDNKALEKALNGMKDAKEANPETVLAAATNAGKGKFSEKMADRFRDRLHRRHENRVELGKPNKQGLECVKDDKVPGGFRFKATKDVELKTGIMTKNGEEKTLRLKKGETTGLYVPHGRTQREAFAKFTHGDKDINMLLDHNSRIDIDKHNKQTDILSKHSLVTDSQIKLGPDAEMGSGNLITKSHANFNKGVVEDNHINNAQVKSHNDLKHNGISDEYQFENHGAVTNSQFERGSFVSMGGTPTSNLKTFNANIMNTDSNHQIENANINNANVYNSDLYDTAIQDGTLNQAKINHSKLMLNGSSRVIHSEIHNTVVNTGHGNSSQFVAQDSALNNSRVSVPTGKHQIYNQSSINYADSTGTITMDQSMVDANKDNIAVLRNMKFEKGVISNLNHPVALTEMSINGSRHEFKHGQLDTFKVEKNDAVKDLTSRLSHPESEPTDSVKTDEGSVSRSDMNTVQSASVKPINNEIEHVDSRDFNAPIDEPSIDPNDDLDIGA